MKKILVIGTKGMAGHVIKKYFSEKLEYVTYGIARNVVESELEFNLDISNTDRLYEIIKKHSFNVIINCIGILNKDAENNPEKAIWFNSYFPHLLEKWLKETETKLIHISTDCVFSGKKGAYKDNDWKDGIGFYAQSKALGEIINMKDLTVRTSIIGPELNENGIGLFHWFMSQELNQSINGYSQAFWSGITTIELAKVIHEMIQQNIVGLYQVARADKIDKYGLLQVFNKVFRENSLSIIENNKYKVDKSLISTRIDFMYKLPTYFEMVMEMKEWISKNNTLYPKKYNN